MKTESVILQGRLMTEDICMGANQINDSKENMIAISEINESALDQVRLEEADQIQLEEPNPDAKLEEFIYNFE
jgi:hypothetical protein